MLSESVMYLMLITAITSEFISHTDMTDICTYFKNEFRQLRSTVERKLKGDLF